MVAARGFRRVFRIRCASPDPDRLLLPVDPAVTVGTLPNGLRYYIRVNHRPAKRAELRLVVNAGSVLEDDDQQGLARFAEHMAFNGTTHFKKQELVEFIESIGMRFKADLNAGTSFDETVYELQVPTDSAHIVRKAFEILEDWAHGVTFDTTGSGRSAVWCWRWRLGRGAGSACSTSSCRFSFAGRATPNGFRSGPRSASAVSPAVVRRFYTDWYRPDLMAVVAVGDFDAGVIEGLIKQRFSNISAGPRPGAAGADGAAASDSGGDHCHRSGSDQHLGVGLCAASRRCAGDSRRLARSADRGRCRRDSQPAALRADSKGQPALHWRRRRPQCAGPDLRSLQLRCRSARLRNPHRAHRGLDGAGAGGATRVHTNRSSTAPGSNTCGEWSRHTPSATRPNRARSPANTSNIT